MFMPSCLAHGHEQAVGDRLRRVVPFRMTGMGPWVIVVQSPGPGPYLQHFRQPVGFLMAWGRVKLIRHPVRGSLGPDRRRSG